MDGWMDGQMDGMDGMDGMESDGMESNGVEWMKRNGRTERMEEWMEWTDERMGLGGVDGCRIDWI